MIFVTGPTGNVGTVLLPLLIGSGVSVRALAHTPASRKAIETQGAEVADGDLDHPETLDAAMAGCDRLFLLSPPAPEQPRREMAAIDAAKRAGVEHVVALSVTGADSSSASPLARWHGEIDDYLATSGLNFAVLRPTGFMHLHLLPIHTVRTEGRWYGMTGDGPAAFVDAADVAGAAAGALTRPGLTGSIYEITGPEAITMPQAAAQLSDAIGREVAYVDVAAEQFQVILIGAGLPQWIAEGLVNFYQSIRDGHMAAVTQSVEELAGHAPRTYRQVLNEHKEAFAGT